MILNLNESKLSINRLKFIIEKFRKFELNTELNIDQYNMLLIMFALQYSTKAKKDEKLIFDNVFGRLILEKNHMEVVKNGRYK